MSRGKLALFALSTTLDVTASSWTKFSLHKGIIYVSKRYGQIQSKFVRGLIPSLSLSHELMKFNSPTVCTSIDRRAIISAPFTPFIWLCSVDIKRGEFVYKPLTACI
jgi:hypothetical protein